MHLISDLDIGGAEMIITSLLCRLNRERYAVSVCALRRTGPLATNLEQAGVKVFTIPFASRTSTFGIIKLARLMKQERVEIAHTHLRRSSVAGRIAAMLAGVPVIVHHEHSDEREPKWRQRWIYRLLTRRTGAVICPSNHVKKSRLAWTGATPAPFMVLPNGIDFSRFSNCVTTPDEIRNELNLPADVPVVGIVGRLNPIKDHSLFLQTATRILETEPASRFLIVGDGPLKSQLVNEAASLGISDKVTFTGPRYDPERLYRAMNLLLLTSSSEGFGLVILEAQASGVPVVASPVAAIPELIVDGKTGILADRTPESLAAGVTRLLDDKTLYKHIRDNSIKAAAAYDLPFMVSGIESIYENLLKSSEAGK